MSAELLDMTGAFLGGAGWFALLWLALPIMRALFPKTPWLMDMSHHVISIIDAINVFIGEAVKWLLPLLVLSVAISVFALSIFGISSTKLSESAQYFHATVIMLGAAMALLANEHVRVDIIQSRLSPPAKALVDFIGFYAFLMPVCLLLIWSSTGFVRFAWQIWEGSAETDGIRGIFLLKTLIPLFAITLLAQGLSIALRAVMTLQGQTQPERPRHIAPLFEEPPK